MENELQREIVEALQGFLGALLDATEREVMKAIRAAFAHASRQIEDLGRVCTTEPATRSDASTAEAVSHEVVPSSSPMDGVS
jgi:hypothetical protein